MDAANFREVMGFSAGQEVIYEDDEADTSIPDIQKITKRNNILPINGSSTTMNLNHLVLENIIQSTYYKNFLCEVTTFQQVVEEVYYNVTHLEPWERGTRKLHGMSGMCGGVRGVGAGGIISTAFCLLYKLFTLRVTRKQLVSMINSTQSVYLRGMGFIYIRFTQPPADLWAWFSSYLDDEDEIDPRSGGGDTMTMGEMLKNMLTKLDWYGTLFPRIPIPIQKEIDQKLKDVKKPHGYDAAKSWKNDKGNRRKEDERHDRQHESASRSHESHGPRRKRCGHHLRHHHCHKHRKICPKKAKMAANKEKTEEAVFNMADGPEWCLIESDPGVFTELIRNFGVTGAQVEEIYTLDDEAFAELKPVHGLIFLFKLRPGDEPSGKLDVENKNNIFFAQQVINNACATQAIVNLLLNVKSDDIQLGSTLEEFKNFTIDFDPANRGLCLSNSEPLRAAHNSFARQQLFELDIRGHGKEDNFHFITYLPVNGRVYELDGLQRAPIDLGPIKEGEEWLQTIRPIIEKRIQKYTEGEIHFNLMAVISDRKDKYLKRIAELASCEMESDDNEAELRHLQELVEREEHKWENQRKENVRRRHNYVPFIVELLKILAKEQKLVPLVEQAIGQAQSRKSVE